jgi:putative redox protein
MAVVKVSTDSHLLATITDGKHTWYADESVEGGGSDSAADPVNMLRGALGACIGITLQAYAHRKNWPLEKVEVAVNTQRFTASEYPAYQGDASFVHEIREHIVLHGPLTDEQRARLLDIATKCPVRRILANPTFFVELEPAPE